jgi:hypothetical protein
MNFAKLGRSVSREHEVVFRTINVIAMIHPRRPGLAPGPITPGVGYLRKASAVLP